MIQLLNKDQLLTLNLLELFQKENNPYFSKSIGYYATTTNIDRRTILRLLELFVSDIEEQNWYEKITLEITDKEVTISIGKEFSLDFFYNFYLQNTTCFDLCLEIFTGDFTTVQDFSDRLFLSKSTVYKRISSLKSVLKDYNLTLDFNSPQIILGPEHQIRYFFYILFFDSFETGYCKFSEFDLYYIEELITDFRLKNSELNYPSLVKLKIKLAISLIRINQGYILNYEEKFFNLTNITISLPKFSDFFHTWFTREKIDCQGNESKEIAFLYFFTTIVDSFDIRQFEKIDLNSIEILSPSLDLAKNWTLLFSSFFNVMLTPTQYFFLSTNLAYLHQKTQGLIGPMSTFELSSADELIKKYYPMLSSKLQEFYSILKKDPLFSGLFEKNPLISFQYTILLREIILSHCPPLNILIYSKLGREQQIGLENSVSTLTSIPINFISSLKENPDIVITDFNFSPYYETQKAYTYFRCSTFPTTIELNQIKKIMGDKISYLYKK
ncbi:MAG: helix-turn-helix domain-containing protein [Carnobacterium sp.]|uniref:helix-turn-helix domain-containing protein n=1 Tax=Carnobacterium TaxID=2747 RepID=UPI001D41881F|nr:MULTISPECIES: helix-turn-helix domain-containing protein [Carnobacterium]MBQ6485365.1 helix-turn-helix domain-containing protein [Carnobacterium sp.]MCC4313333.1 hypothetical protein [Carnobacterium maltaromaticum]